MGRNIHYIKFDCWWGDSNLFGLPSLQNLEYWRKPSWVDLLNSCLLMNCWNTIGMRSQKELHSTNVLTPFMTIHVWWQRMTGFRQYQNIQTIYRMMLERIVGEQPGVRVVVVEWCGVGWRNMLLPRKITGWGAGHSCFIYQVYRYPAIPAPLAGRVGMVVVGGRDDKDLPWSDDFKNAEWHTTCEFTSAGTLCCPSLKLPRFEILIWSEEIQLQKKRTHVNTRHYDMTFRVSQKRGI